MVHASNQTVQHRAVELLRDRARQMTTGEVCLALDVPLLDADSALEKAYLAGEVEFTAGQGWRALS